MKILTLLPAIFLFVGCESSVEKKEMIKANITQISHRLEKSDSKQSYSSDQIQFLKNMNLTHSKTFSDNLNLADEKLTKFYFDEYHLKFLSEEFIQSFLKEKELVIGDLPNYIGNIPPENIDEFKRNYENILKSEDYKRTYFIRVSLRPESSNQPGKFLQIINENEIEPMLLNGIHSGKRLVAHGQELDTGCQLKKERYSFYSKKYGLSKDIIVDCMMNAVAPQVKIIAPQEMFNLDGKIVVGNEIKDKPKDPAILFKVNEGWVALTTWK